MDNQEFNHLDVVLIQDLVDTAVLGSIVTVTGIVKHEISKKSTKKSEGKFFKPYLKCFNATVLNKSSPTNGLTMTVDEKEIIEIAKALPSPFRVLVHSLCPTIFGREEVKAGLVLALLSGADLLKKHRSESHVLMVGNPGTGKSKMLQACAEVSKKGMLISGPTSTAAGLTASVGKKGVMDAGSLVLANGGVCCIDEFDKMKTEHTLVLLESMEQQVISIAKCGVRVNLPSNVVIIAAANPVGSFYDKTKTLMENVRLRSPLLSRFDLIFPLTEQAKTSDAAFMDHLNKKPQMIGNQSNAFFSPQRAVNKDKISWLKLQPGENLDLMPSHIAQLYIGYARENAHPTLSDEAKDHIRSFFLQLQGLTMGAENQIVSLRQLEALIRLTLARARADLAEIATKEHAVDVINIFKSTMPDIFADESMIEEDGASTSSSFKKSKAPNCSSMSKPKQSKAFIDHLREQDEDTFTSGDLRSIGKELGIIKDYQEIIERLNYAGEIIKTVDGYRVV